MANGKGDAFCAGEEVLRRVRYVSHFDVFTRPMVTGTSVSFLCLVCGVAGVFVSVLFCWVCVVFVFLFCVLFLGVG